jgi:hypothetical protein
MGEGVGMGEGVVKMPFKSLNVKCIRMWEARDLEIDFFAYVLN